jgi:hypothetical protein
MQAWRLRVRSQTNIVIAVGCDVCSGLIGSSSVGVCATGDAFDENVVKRTFETNYYVH